MEQTAKTNVEVLQGAGIVHKNHTMNEHDQKLLNSLSKSEVDALISIKNKLGEDFLRKTTKDGRFPHPDTSAF